MDTEHIEALRFATEAGAAWGKALELLGRRNHGTRELHLKLLKKTYSENVCNAVLSRLQEKDVINDSVFAEDWITSRLLRHPEGYFNLRSGLLKRGIPRDCAERGLERVFTDDTALDTARRVCDKEARKAGEDFSAEEILKKRGFRIHIIRLYLESLEC